MVNHSSTGFNSGIFSTLDNDHAIRRQFTSLNLHTTFANRFFREFIARGDVLVISSLRYGLRERARAACELRILDRFACNATLLLMMDDPISATLGSAPSVVIRAREDTLMLNLIVTK